MKLLLKISIITVFCFFVMNNIHAQLVTPIDGVTIALDDSNPKPEQDVEVYIESYNFDLNSSSIVWFVDGKVQNQGIGVTRTNITSPKIGLTTNVLVKIKGSDGREVNKSISIKSGSVDIIWESDGYYPAFFKGKLPFSHENKIKLIAIPHLAKDKTREIDPKTLVYSWKLGGKYIDNGQGYGKQVVFVNAGEIPKTLDISVDVSNREQTEHTVGLITLNSDSPTLSFYEQDALYGILFNKSLSGNVPLINTEMKIIAVPFGFNLKNKDVTYNWSVNGINQEDLQRNRSIVVRTKGDTGGSSSINLDIRNQDNILQGANGGFMVNFNKK